MSYRKGHNPDPVGHRMTSFRVCRARLTAATPTLPDSVDLEPFAPDVLDQNDTSSCVGHASGCSIATTCAAQGRPLGFIPSPKDIYTDGRGIDRVPNPDGSLPPLQDNGCEPNQAMRGIAEVGLAPMAVPSDGGPPSDCRPATINDEPTLTELERQSPLLAPGEKRIDSIGAERITDICLALASKTAVAFAAFVDTAFENWTPDKGPIGSPNYNDPNGGGHYLYFIGYRTVVDAAGVKRRIFKVRNSWGKTWGLNGNIEATEDFVAGIDDVYVMNPTFKTAAVVS